MFSLLYIIFGRGILTEHALIATIDFIVESFLLLALLNLLGILQ